MTRNGTRNDFFIDVNNR